MGRIFKKNQKGFTLIELLMVVSIIGILMAIVAPAVAGTGEKGTEAQVESDGRQTQTAVDNYNNKSTKTNAWPEKAFGSTYKDPLNGSRKFLDKDGNQINNFPTTHTELDGNAATTVWQDDGKVITVSWVPGFLLKVPSSFLLENDEGLKDSNGKSLPEFLWTLKRSSSSASDGIEGRSVAVYRLVSTETGNVAVYKNTF